MKSDLHLGTSMTKLRILCEEARLVEERRQKRAALLVTAAETRRLRLAYIFSGFRKAWARMSW